ncbi:hypothetical protein [Providencia stuartii]|uniref:hypothetical protein n=1 Tax=Providencia stuartii TaxID=588 RepID=UPI00321245BB
MKKLFVGLLLTLGVNFVGVSSAIASEDKKFFIEMVEETCKEHTDPTFCKWQVENLSAISSINTLKYYDCKLHDKKEKECLESIEMFDYIQGQYDKNMRDMTNK